MMNKHFPTVIGVSLVATTLSFVAKPADAFVITNTSATWDNVTLEDGTVVGFDGVAASDNNQVVFREVDGESQVRWGNAAYGWTWAENWELKTYEYTAVERKRVKDWYRRSNGRWKYGWHWKNVEVTKTSQKWVDNGHWVEPTADYKSGLGFEGVSNLSLNVGEVFNVGQLTHFNQTIYDNAANSAELSLALDFGEGIGSHNFDFTISVDETLNNEGNNNNGADCAYHTDAGKGCSDRVAWDFSLDESSSFTYENEEYSLELVGFADSLASRNLVSDFISQEKANNSANIFARLVKVDRTQDIPEPSSLLGLAGLGLVFARSRKQQPKAATA